MKSIKIIEKTFEVLILTFAYQKLLMTSAKTIVKLKNDAKNAFISGLLSATLSDKHANTDISDIFGQVNQNQNTFQKYFQYIKESEKLGKKKFDILREKSLNIDADNIYFQYSSVIRNNFLFYKVSEKFKDNTLMIYIMMLPLVAITSLNMFVSVVFFQMGKNVAKVTNILVPDSAKLIVKTALYLDYFLNIQSEIINIMLLPLKGAELIIDSIAIFAYGVYESLDKKIEIDSDNKSNEKNSSLSERIKQHVTLIKKEIAQKAALSDLNNKKIGNAEYKSFMLGMASNPKLFVKKSTLTWVQKLEYCKAILEAVIDTVMSHIFASSYQFGIKSGKFINYLLSDNKNKPQKNAAHIMKEEKTIVSSRAPAPRKAVSERVLSRKP